MTRRSDMGMEIGLLAGLLVLNLLFQFVPPSDLGRLSSRTFDNTLEAVDAFLPYDSSVEEQQDEVVEEQAAIEEQVEQIVEEIPDVVIALGPDTVGLSTVGTVETGITGSGTDPAEIGPPVFTPVEVFPVCTYMPPPAYPEMARMAGVEGVVTLWIYVDGSGVVREVDLMHGSGVNSLDEAAMAAALNTRWSPARNNNAPVGVWTTLRYVFSLSD
jgi:protein TonB